MTLTIHANYLAFLVKYFSTFFYINILERKNSACNLHVKQWQRKDHTSLSMPYLLFNFFPFFSNIVPVLSLWLCKCSVTLCPIKRKFHLQWKHFIWPEKMEIGEIYLKKHTEKLELWVFDYTNFLFHELTSSHNSFR